MIEFIRSGEEFLEEPTLFSGNQTHSSHVYLPFYEAQKLQTSKSFVILMSISKQLLLRLSVLSFSSYIIFNYFIFPSHLQIGISVKFFTNISTF
jgi:hypothetical protein